MAVTTIFNVGLLVSVVICAHWWPQETLCGVLMSFAIIVAHYGSRRS